MLEAAHLIRAQFISPDHRRKYFTLAVEPYHFTCRRCHRVIAFASDLVELLKQRLETDLHVQALNACVCVEGLCPACQAEEQKENSMSTTLDQLTPGEKARVKHIGGQGAIRRRLMDMGLVRGVEIELIKAAPMGDPLEFRLRGYNLSLRKAEAQMVELEA
jgi:ferrous iron transport protein A